MTRARNGAADNVETGRWNLVGAQAGIVRVYNWRSDAESTCRRYNADPWLDAETPDPDAPYRVEDARGPGEHPGSRQWHSPEQVDS